MFPVIKYEKFDFGESCYVDSGVKWKASSFYDAAKDQGCQPFDLPLAGIDLNAMPFKIKNVDDLAYHMKRVMMVDLKYPIMLDCQGTIVDC
jgi:hypothetical protein